MRRRCLCETNEEAEMSIESPINEMLIDVSEGVAILTLNQPTKLNAFTLDMWEALGQICEQVNTDDGFAYTNKSGQ